MFSETQCRDVECSASWLWSVTVYTGLEGCINLTGCCCCCWLLDSWVLESHQGNCKPAAVGSMSRNYLSASVCCVQQNAETKLTNERRTSDFSDDKTVDDDERASCRKQVESSNYQPPMGNRTVRVKWSHDQ